MCNKNGILNFIAYSDIKICNKIQCRDGYTRNVVLQPVYGKGAYAAIDRLIKKCII